MFSVSETERPRGAPRLKLFQPTLWHDAATGRRAHLLDLSASGALVHAAEPPAPGARIRIDVAGEPRNAQVAWGRGQRFGVRFTVPLTPAEIATAIAA